MTSDNHRDPTGIANRNLLDRVTWRAVKGIAILVVIYGGAYLYFKSHCFDYVPADPWIGGDPATSFSMTLSWAEVDLKTGRILSVYRPVRHSFGQVTAECLNRIFYPAGQVDQWISGWQITFCERF